MPFKCFDFIHKVKILRGTLLERNTGYTLIFQIAFHE